MNRGAWWATVRGVTKSQSDTTAQLTLFHKLGQKIDLPRGTLGLWVFHGQIHPILLSHIFVHFSVDGRLGLISICLIISDRFIVIPWTAAHQAPLSIEFSRQEYWSG